MMGYVAAGIGLLFIISGDTGKTGNRYALLRLPEEMARTMYIGVGAMGIALGVAIIFAEHKK